MTAPIIKVYYDTGYPGVYVLGADTSAVYLPGTLSATVDQTDQVSIWLGNQIARVVGPIPFGWLTDKNGNPFLSSALLLAYLSAQFALSPTNSGPVLVDEFVATANGAMSKTYATALPTIVAVLINGLWQSPSEYSVSGVTLTLFASLDILIGDKISITT